MSVTSAGGALRAVDRALLGLVPERDAPGSLAFEPVVAAYRAIRPAGRFDALDPNPGR